MAPANNYGYYASTPQPATVSSKHQQASMYPYPQYQQRSLSPPEVSDSGASASGQSYDPSAVASSYAASASDYEGTTSTSSVDLLDYMNDCLQKSYNPIQLDHSLVQQAQLSGEMNAKTRKLMELQLLAQQQFAAMQAQFATGLQDAQEVQRDLEWTQKKVSSMNKRAAKKYAKEYAMAQQRYPSYMES